MLNEQLSQQVREAGGESLLLDARLGRALLGDSSQVLTLCKQLRNIGFSRFVDFTAMHLGVEQVELIEGGSAVEQQVIDRFQLWLTVRAPEHDHAALTLKWSWPPSVGAGLRPAQGGSEPRPYEDERDEPESEAVDVDPELARMGVAAHAIKPPGALEELSEGNGDALPHEKAAGGPTNGDAETGYNGDGGAGQPGDPSQQAGSAAHPSLSHNWPAAGLAEREIWEMLGLRFTGHDNLAPLLLSEQFADFPLRRGYEAPRREQYAAQLLKERHERAMLNAVVGATHVSPATDDDDVGAGPRARPRVKKTPEDGPTRGSAPTEDPDPGDKPGSDGGEQ